MIVGICKLCRKSRQLEHSHVIPAFVYRWQRATSGNGHIRTTQQPNLRSQDGPKEYWRCGECEDRFNVWETAFANKIFYPYLGDPSQQCTHGDELSKFCVSVSWRVLTLLGFEKGALSGWPEEQANKARAAEVAWREFLLGQRSDPGDFRQHLLPLNVIPTDSPEMAPNINRYLLRAIHMGMARSEDTSFVFSKLGQFAIFGVIDDKYANEWTGTEVALGEGVVGGMTYGVPEMLVPYLNDQAMKVRDAFGTVSDKQHKKIAQAFRANIDRFANSEALKVMQKDVEAFGSDAFSPRRP